MLAESKVSNPLLLSLNTTEKKYILLGEQPEISDINLLKQGGCVIGSNNYGFKIISSGNETLYSTQCRITAIEIKDGLLKIHEEGKHFPWKFSLDGNCINSAIFFSRSRRDVEYLTSVLGIHSALLERVNGESYSVVSDNTNIGNFLDWYSLKDETLIINSKVKKINRRLFNENLKNKNTIKTIILEDGIKTVDAGSFSDFLSLTTLYIPESLENISLYIADERILNNLRVFYKGKKLPIRYGDLSSCCSGQSHSTIKIIDDLYRDFETEDEVMRIKRISRKTVQALYILDFSSVSTVIFETDFVADPNDKKLLEDYNEAINRWDSINKVIFKKSCATIIPRHIDYQYNGEKLELDCEVHPDLAKLITKEITNLLSVEDESIFNLVLDLLGKYKIYLSDERKCSKLFVLGFADVVKALKQYGSFDDTMPYLPKPIIEDIIKILCGDEALIVRNDFIGGTIDFNEYQNYLTFKKVFGIEQNGMIEACTFTNNKIIMPPLALFTPVSFYKSSFNNVQFENILSSSWQPTIYDDQVFEVEKSLGSGITFKNELYLRFGRECNATCETCWNKTLPPETFNFDDIVKALSSLSPYLDDIFIGGGEPTLKNEYLLKLRRLFDNINTTVISNGSATSDIYKMLWSNGFNIGISRYSTSADDNKGLFGTSKSLSNSDLSALIEEQRKRRLTIFATCIPGHLYSTEKILEFIDTFHKLGCNIVFQSPMLDKTLGNSRKIYDLDNNPCRQIFGEVGKILKKSNFSNSAPIIGTAGYNLVVFEKSGFGVISFKNYITSRQYDEAWLYAIKRTFDFSITSEGNIYENWNNGGRELVLKPKTNKRMSK